MSDLSLPARASLDYLRKVAKERLCEMRREIPQAKLADALHGVAQSYGFSSWRALKAEVDRRQAAIVSQFFSAIRSGDDRLLRSLLAQDPGLVHVTDPERKHPGWTGQHEAADRGNANALGQLLAAGADPNAREVGDNTTALFWAAVKGHVPCCEILLAANADVHGFGDVHQADVIGWAALWAPHESREEVVRVLVQHGARHHVFSALALGNADLVREVVEANPGELDRRMSKFEHGQTPLHFALSNRRYDLMTLLLEFEPDLEAMDGHRNTVLQTATLRNDRQAIDLLLQAGARPLAPISAEDLPQRLDRLGETVAKSVTMVSAPDIERTLDWYRSIGFREVDRFADDGVVNWGMASYGAAQIMFSLGEAPKAGMVSLWFYTSQVDALYDLIRVRQASLQGDEMAVEFLEELYEPFYGGRQFSIRDPNGYALCFLQSGG
jgi:ankyrin repeat protein